MAQEKIKTSQFYKIPKTIAQHNFYVLFMVLHDGAFQPKTS